MPLRRVLAVGGQQGGVQAVWGATCAPGAQVDNARLGSFVQQKSQDVLQARHPGRKRTPPTWAVHSLRAGAWMASSAWQRPRQAAVCMLGSARRADNGFRAGSLAACFL